MSKYKDMSKEELVEKFEELVENKETAPTSVAYDDYCEEIADIKKEILLRMTK